MSPVDSSGVRARREKLGISQRELARRAGIYQATLSAIETGKARRVTVDMLEALATALDCDTADLLKSTPRKRK